MKEQLLKLFSDAESPQEKIRVGRTKTRWQNMLGL